MVDSMSGPVLNSANSPSKALRVNTHATFKPSLDQKRDEERAMARDKIYCIQASEMLEDFFPKPRSNAKAIPHVFQGRSKRFSSEPEMYEWIVSTRLFIAS